MQKLSEQFIDNRWVSSHGIRYLPVSDPHRETTIADVTVGDSALGAWPPIRKSSM